MITIRTKCSWIFY